LPLNMAILTGVRYDLYIVLICISFTAREVECIYWLFVPLPLKIPYLIHVPISSLGCWFFWGWKLINFYSHSHPEYEILPCCSPMRKNIRILEFQNLQRNQSSVIDCISILTLLLRLPRIYHASVSLWFSFHNGSTQPIVSCLTLPVS
jgi:hypothetical protein